MPEFGRNVAGGLYFLHTFRRLLQYSTSCLTDETPSLVNYLVDSLGFSKRQALSTSAKLSDSRRRCGSKVSDFNFSGNANSVIEFLKHNGFSQSQIRTLVSSYPRFLVCNVDKTLKPKIELLQGLGLTRSDLAHIITATPNVFLQGLYPAIQALRGVMGSCDQDIARIMKRLNFFSFSHAGKHLVHNIGLLESYGISREKIKKGFFQQPSAFVKRADLFRDIVKKVDEEWGIPRDAAMFLYGIQLVACLSEKTIEAKCQIFRSFGWTEHDIIAILRHNPYCLTSSEERIKKSLEFLMNEVGYEPALLVSCSCLFTYSLEKRLVPRHKALLALKEKGLVRANYPLYTAVALTESKFLKRFVEPFKDVLPDLHQLFVKSRESPVKLNSRAAG